MHPVDHYPASAYPVLLPKAANEPDTYVQGSEDDGSVGVRCCWRGPVTRSRKRSEAGLFVVSNYRAAHVRIDWGGAFSAICASPEESVAGSGIDFVT